MPRPVERRTTKPSTPARTSDDIADWYDARLRLHGSRGDLFVARRSTASRPEHPPIIPVPFGRADRDSIIIPPLRATPDTNDEPALAEPVDLAAPSVSESG